MGKHKTEFILCSLFVLSLFSFSLVSAIPPVLQTVQAGSLEIVAPSFVEITQYKTFDFYWHVFNTSTILTNTTTQCAYHLYSKNSHGEHIYFNNYVRNSVDGRDFEVSINGNNFSTIGDYCHLIECNTSSQTGGLERCFVVTSKGDSEINTFNLYILLGIAAFAILIIGIATRNIPVTILGGFATTLVGLYSLNNGIAGYRNTLSQWISILVMLFGGLWGVIASFEYLKGADEL